MTAQTRADIRRFYLTLGGRQVHVAAVGRGPALLMLHTPPLWWMSVEPLLMRLAECFTVIAPDLAGYGLSDALAAQPSSSRDYARDLTAVLDRLGVRRYALYASEVAAPIAVALAVAQGDRLTALVLDEPLLLTDSEKRSLREHGLPSFAPESSGAHLLRMWDYARSRFLFQPAHESRLANRLDRDMASPVELDWVVKAYMRAGERYPTAILAGLDDPWSATLAGMPLPTLVLANERATDARLPFAGARVTVRRLSCEPIHRAAAIAAFLSELPAADRVDLATTLDLPPRGPDFSRIFIPVPGGHLHARANLEGSGRPVLAMHDPAGSHALVLPFVRGLLGTRPVIALDMPGNGESDNTVGTTDVSSADYARAVIEALDSLGLTEVDVIGRYSGGPIGMEMSFQRPDLVRHLVQAAIDLYDTADVTDVLQNYMPDMTPVRDGSHLALGWYNMKSQALFWPWFRQTRAAIVWGEPQLDPDLIQQRVFDLLRVGNMYYQAYAAMWTYPMAERLPQLRVPTLLCAPRWDPIYPGVARAARVAPPNCKVETLPDRFADWAGAFARFFDEA